MSEGVSRFVLNAHTTAVCPKCQGRVHLLQDHEAYEGTPSFYICFNSPTCKWVGQVGVGPVEEGS